MNEEELQYLLGIFNKLHSIPAHKYGVYAGLADLLIQETPLTEHQESIINKYASEHKEIKEFLQIWVTSQYYVNNVKGNEYVPNSETPEGNPIIQFPIKG